MSPTVWHIAQMNVGRAVAPVDSPALADFMAALDGINALADAAPGFVWRLQTEAGNATDIKPTEDPQFIVNMSVWASVEALFDVRLPERAHAGHGPAPRMVREAGRGLSGAMVGAGRPPADGRGGVGAARPFAPPWARRPTPSPSSSAFRYRVKRARPTTWRPNPIASAGPEGGRTADRKRKDVLLSEEHILIRHMARQFAQSRAGAGRGAARPHGRAVRAAPGRDGRRSASWA